MPKRFEHERGEPSDAEHEEPAASGSLIERLRQQGRKGSRYRVLGEVAAGGMGAIWQVWDEDLRRELAMKVVLARDAGSTAATTEGDARSLGRFLEEAQITGQLDHPGIVPVHELGLTADGRVYFTMRLVRGGDLEHVFDLVAEGREGWTQTRALGVLLKVCEAMSYAHAKGVIHRDLKPANVMVGSYGEVYVMDWGLARVLGTPEHHDLRIQHAPPGAPELRTERRATREGTPDSALATMDGEVVGTPAYMPPEQAKGQLELLGPHSDVYSLGAMLYHLLTGAMPYASRGARASQHEVLMRVIASAPEPLHALAPDAPAELIAICERAMAREAASRYRDTQELADDLRAYLEDRVVRAHATGAWAEASKWVRRNKPLATALVAAGLAVVLGGIGFAIQAGRASRSAADARTMAEEARRASAAAEESARLASANERLAREREREARASEARAETVTELVQKALTTADPHQGGSQEHRVVDAMQFAMRELESGALAADPQTEAALQQTISAILNGNGRAEEALRLAEQALETRQRLFAGDHVDVATSIQNVADCLDSLGRSEEALPRRHAALDMNRRLFQGDAADVAASLNNLGSCLAALGRPEEALPAYEAALAMAQRLVPGDHADVAGMLDNVAACLDSLGRGAEALPKHEAALEMRRRLLHGDHPAVAANLNNVATCLESLGRSAEALEHFEVALEMIQRLFPGDQPEVATSLNNLGACLGSLGRGNESLARFEAALEMRERLFRGDHPDTASSLNNVAVCLGALGRNDEALPRIEAALGMLERLYPGDHPDVARTLDNLGMCLESLGQSADALPAHELALEMRERLHAGDHADVALSLAHLASCLVSLDRAADALAQAERADAMARRVLPEGHPWRRSIAATHERIRGSVAR